MSRAVAAGRFLAPVVCAAFVTLAAHGQSADRSPGRAGGLVPGGEGRRAGLTREELVREWDLDGDGTISKSEADVARGRMRKRRLEMQLQTDIDPLAGDAIEADVGGDEWTAQAGAEPEFRLPPELPPPPRAQPAEPGRPPVSGRASWLPPQRLSSALTGGVRAGAPAAAPGYGAGPWADLNAGRRPPPERPTGTGPATAEAASGGGLLPSSRPPGRTGAILLPVIPGRAGPSTRPAAPARPTPPPLVPRPRITAEEIGGYRP